MSQEQKFAPIALKLLDDIFADLDLRARAIGDVKNGKAILDLSNGLVIRYYDLKEDIAAAPTQEPQQLSDVEALRRISHELRTYSPAGDEYKGAHIHKVWAKEIDAAIERAVREA